MNPSKLLRRFLDSGKRPSSQREASALLDESRSLLVSQLPTTGEVTMSFTDEDLDGILANGKKGVLERAVALHRKRNLSAPQPSRPAPAPPAATAKALPARPAPKPINSKTTNPPSTTPHLDQFEKLEGTAASHFYATHGAAIRAESGTRQHEKKNLEKEMNAARATARQRSDLKKITR